MARGFTDGESTPSQIPREYLDCVEIRAYHVELFLAVETASFSGRVRIPVHIAGAARRVFYLHAADLEFSSATMNGVLASVERVNTSLIRLKMPAEGAVAGEQVIEVLFRGVISTWRPEGISMLGDEVSGPPFFPRTCGVAGRGGGGSDGDDGPGGNNTALDNNRQVGQPGGFPRRGVLGTHLEPTHARDLFPCVDLPSCKAVFHLTLHGVPAHLQAISNSPILRVEEGLRVGAADAKGTAMKGPPKKSVSFQPTPVMPTYIFGFWVGDFQCLTTHAIAPSDGRNAALMCCKALSTDVTMTSAAAAEKPPGENGRGNNEEEERKEGAPEVEINVHVLRTVSLEGAQFSLDLTRRAFELFSGLFAVRFPLPKLDMLGLPMMHGLGMENFGAITMLQDYMVVTRETTFVRRRRIARLICHEVCHQWYGDIVTPQSFDELWLKEGLARFFEYIAVDALDSSYRVWTNFMSEVFFQAMLADAQDSSHPVVQQHNGDISSILQSFDTITYCKGASVLRMLCHCVGPSRFLEGTRRFVVDHQYACATQEDLWRAVQSVCDQDGVALNVRDLMRPWLTRAMFPVLRVRMSGAHTLSITQLPFSFKEIQLTSASDGVVSSTEAAEASPSPAEGSTASSETNTSSVNERQTGQSPVVRRNDQNRDRAPETASENTSGVSNDASTGVVDTAAVLTSGATETHRAAPSSRLRPITHGVGEGKGASPWVVPLRIRVANVSRSSSDDDAVGSGGVEIGTQREHIARGPGARAGEEMYSFLMSERSTSVVLAGLSRAPINVGAHDDGPSDKAVRAAANEGTQANELRQGGSNDAENGRATEKGENGDRPYLVMNDGHSGFFTVQYECERSWALALAALEQGVLSECEATGVVHDLILGLHQRVIFERFMNLAGSGRGTYGARSDVTHLLSRLQEVVRLLGRDRSHPAWCTGQLFIWEMHMMHASNTIGELREMIRQRRDPSFARCRPGSAHNGEASVPTFCDTPPEHDRSNRLNPQQPSGTAPSSSTDGNVTGEGSSRPTSPEIIGATAAKKEKAEYARVVMEAGTLFRRIMVDLKLACEEAEEHVQWHSERVASGVEQAAESLQSLQIMHERLQRFRAQLSSSEASFRARDGNKGAGTPGAGDGSGKKVKIGAAGSANSLLR